MECASQAEDLRHLKEKVDCGVDFLVTQMFFDNSALYSFLYRAQEAGITVPVLAGDHAGDQRRADDPHPLPLSGTTLPNRFRMILDKFRERPDAMKQAGIVYAAEQMVDLVANGVRGVHVYTMNKPDVARKASQKTCPRCWAGHEPRSARNRPLLGHPGKALDPQGAAWADQCQGELAQAVTPRHLGRRLPLTLFQGQSRDLDHHLRHCREGILYAVTPGPGGRPAPPPVERPVHGQGRRGPGGVRRLAG